MNTNMTSEQALELLTPQALLAWAASKPAEQPIGYEGMKCKCPIAEFYTEQGIEVQVGTLLFLDSFTVKDGAAVKLPSWAKYFAQSMDDGDASEQFPISVEEAQAMGGRADGEPCAKDALFAVMGEGGEWYQNVIYRPMAGEVVVILDDLIKRIAKNPGEFTDTDV